MGSYYHHTRRERVEVPYSFQCEHCGQDSGLLSAVITGMAGSVDSIFKTLSPKNEQKLQKEAHKFLVREVKNVHKDAVEKKIFSADFNDQCPYCHRPQSWAVSGLKKQMYDTPFVCLGVSIFAAMWAMLVYFIDDDKDLKALMPYAAVVFIAIGMAAAIFHLMRNRKKINKKSKEAASSVQHLPVIYWDVVQNLLNE